jgi:putative transcriptional regulator
MHLQQGCCIRSTEKMDDPNFKGTTILVAELNTNGALGFILNQPFGRKLNELVEFSSIKPFPLYTGGPVDSEQLYFVHQAPSIISGGQLVAENLFFGGNFKEAVEAIDAGLLDVDDIKIFVGYCGWDAGELEAEIEEGSWQITNFLLDGIFQ